MKQQKNSDKKRSKTIILSLTGLFIVLFVSIYIGFVKQANDKEIGLDDGYTNDETVNDLEPDEEPDEVIAAIVNLEDALIIDTNKGNQLYYNREAIKGIYLSAYTAGGNRLDEYVELANETEINAFVIDVKSDDGRITFNMDIELADEIGAEYLAIKNVDVLMDKLYDNNIYPIARIVVFKDPFLAKRVNDFAVRNKDGSLFIHNKVPWLNPYNKDIWEYMVSICKEAAEAGFKEIQFDYIRFGEGYRIKNILEEQIDPERTKMDIIVDFLDYINVEMVDYDVEISIDVFGTVITSRVDSDIVGQDYVEMARRVDVICPMIYPSHYGRGYYGIPASELPDSYPYKIIYGSMSDSNKKLSELSEEERPVTRPWLQSFSMHGVKYGAHEIREQINAAYDVGLTEWILWNAGNYYNKSSLLPAEVIDKEEVQEVVEE